MASLGVWTARALGGMAVFSTAYVSWGVLSTGRTVALTALVFAALMKAYETGRTLGWEEGVEYAER